MGGNATNTADYTTLTGSVTIGAGQASATITLTPVDDTLVEGTETAILTLSTSGSYTVGMGWPPPTFTPPTSTAAAARRGFTAIRFLLK